MAGTCALRVVGPLFVFSMLAWAQDDPMAKPEWQSEIELANPSARLATICPDGTVHVLSYRGESISLNRHGKVILYERTGPFAVVDAIACGADNVLVLAVRSRQESPDTFATRPDPTAPYKLPPMTQGVDYDIRALAVIDQYRIVVAGAGGARSQRLHLLGFDGKSIRSFGETATDAASANGYLLWSRKSRLVLFIPQKLWEVQIYDEEGNEVGVRGLGTNRPAAQWGEDAIEMNTGAALLPGGELLVEESIRTSQGAPHLIARLLDVEFNTVAALNCDGFGRLIGADANGAAYFLKGRTMTCARISMRHPKELPPSRTVPVSGWSHIQRSCTGGSRDRYAGAGSTIADMDPAQRARRGSGP